MKLVWKQIEPFVKSPDPAARAILIYGPDSGLARERSAIIGKTVVQDLNDPFNVTVLSTDQITEDPARLSDEAGAISMMGGAKLIRIESASDKISPVLRDYLDSPSEQNLVIVEAGELGPKSPLRQLFEKSKNAAALPCYVEDERGISQLIREMLKDSGYTIQSDALTWLASNIAGDRGRARSEIEKLILYMGQAGGTVMIDDVQNLCGQAGAQSLDDLIYAVGGGRSDAAMKAFIKLQDEGVPAITILRSLQNHFRKLHFIHAQIQAGTPLDAALKTLQPPLFFKLEQPFKAQLQKWDMHKAQNVMARLNDLEAQTKRTGAPVETLTAQAVLSVSSIR